MLSYIKADPLIITGPGIQPETRTYGREGFVSTRLTRTSNELLPTLKIGESARKFMSTST